MSGRFLGYKRKYLYCLKIFREWIKQEICYLRQVLYGVASNFSMVDQNTVRFSKSGSIFEEFIYSCLSNFAKFLAKFCRGGLYISKARVELETRLVFRERATIFLSFASYFVVFVTYFGV